MDLHIRAYVRPAAPTDCTALPATAPWSPRGSDFKLLLAWIVPGAEAADAITLGRRADVVVLLGRSADAPSCRSRNSTGSRRRCDELLAAFRRHRPGPRRRRPGTTEIVAESNPRARWAKSFSNLGYHDLEDDPRPSGAADRRAIVVIGDGPQAAAVVCRPHRPTRLGPRYR